MKNIDFTKVFEKYKGLWIALNQPLDNVLGADKNAKKAYDEAVKKGEKNPVMFKVPTKNTAYFGIICLHVNITT